MHIADCRVVVARIALLPDVVCDETASPKHLIHQHLEVMPLVVVDGDPDRAIVAQQLAQQLQARQHHGQPLGVFQVVVVVLEGAFGVVGRVDEDALDLPAVKRQQAFQRFEVVALDQQVALCRLRVAMRADGFQQAGGHAGGGGEGVWAAEPVEGGHGVDCRGGSDALAQQVAGDGAAVQGAGAEVDGVAVQLALRGLREGGDERCARQFGMLQKEAA